MLTIILIPVPCSSIDWVGTWKSILIKNPVGNTDDQPVLGVTNQSGITLL